MKDLESQIKEHWDSAYRSTPYKKLPWESVKPDEELVKYVAERRIKKGKALEVCCGAGTQSIFLAKKGFDVTGIDISPTAIKIAIKRAKEEKVKINFMTGNSFDLKLDAESFDLVLDRGCFHHIPPEARSRYIEGVARVLKKGGKYFSKSFSKKNGWNIEKEFTLEEVENIFSQYFDVEVSREVVHTQPEGGDVIMNAILMKKK
ncbi:MAG: class I SAM-dependent methyltransferase [Candidatus Aenigmarchaeota archaeon]|nr:class I SAM-dependent methyltransferase [Candidatus Aenigmarchaeota archaeon]